MASNLELAKILSQISLKRRSCRTKICHLSNSKNAIVPTSNLHETKSMQMPISRIRTPQTSISKIRGWISRISLGGHRFSGTAAACSNSNSLTLPSKCTRKL